MGMGQDRDHRLTQIELKRLEHQCAGSNSAFFFLLPIEDDPLKRHSPKYFGEYVLDELGIGREPMRVRESDDDRIALLFIFEDLKSRHGSLP